MERNWRNVPGPFHGADTDTCWSGRMAAPDHVLYDDETGQEFVYRRPRNAVEVDRLLFAAWTDPSSGYGLRSQRVGEAWLTRPLFVKEVWLESEYHRDHLPLEGVTD
ncbi:hypothetical protein [Streptomyces sp. NPDC055005]